MEILFSVEKEPEKFLLDGLHKNARKFIGPVSLEKTDWGFYVYDDKAQVGGVHGSIVDGGWCYIELFYLDEKCRGKGLGKELIEKVEHYAKQNKCFGVCLDTLSFEARGFYEKMGYTVHGELSDYPKKGFSKFFLHKYL